MGDALSISPPNGNPRCASSDITACCSTTKPRFDIGKHVVAFRQKRCAHDMAHTWILRVISEITYTALRNVQRVVYEGFRIRRGTPPCEGFVDRTDPPYRCTGRRECCTPNRSICSTDQYHTWESGSDQTKVFDHRNRLSGCDQAVIRSRSRGKPCKDRKPRFLRTCEAL